MYDKHMNALFKKLTKQRLRKRNKRTASFNKPIVIVIVVLGVLLWGVHMVLSQRPLKTTSQLSSKPSDKPDRYRGSFSYQNFRGENIEFYCDEADGLLKIKSATGKLLWQKPYDQSHCERRIEGERRQYPEKTRMLVILQDQSSYLQCESDESNSLTHCSEIKILGNVNKDNFLMFSKNQKYFLTSPDLVERKKISIVNLETLEEKSVSLQYPFSNIFGGFTSLNQANSFAFWADTGSQSASNIRDIQPMIGIYDGNTVRYIDNIPTQIQWEDYTYTVDGYGQIYYTSANAICFNWTVSGGHGTFLMQNGTFVQDYNGVTDCANLL